MADDTASRTILHVDMDAFFTSVEQHDHPEYRGKPVVVGAPPDRRGVVAAASYEARKYGIHSAMPSREAGRRCPHAVFLPVRGERYQEVSGQVFEVLERFTPLVEPVSIDEAFLDVAGAQRLFGPAERIASRIKLAIRERTGLTASVGVAINKFLAKVASDLQKPDGLTVVPDTPGGIRAFLAPLPVGKVWGVGKVTQRRLESAGILTIGHLQAATMQGLARLVGASAAENLLSLARGEDSREIELDREEKTMSREYTFTEDCGSADEIETVLCDLVEDVGSRLRAHRKYARLGHLKLRWQGFTTISRQKPFPTPCCDDFSLREMALDLFRSEPLIKPVRLIGFGVGQLTDHPARQLTLYEGEFQRQERQERLSRVVDGIRRRFGDGTIRSGRTVKEEPTSET
jgi:DNA polymerase IV